MTRSARYAENANTIINIFIGIIVAIYVALLGLGIWLTNSDIVNATYWIWVHVAIIISIMLILLQKYVFLSFFFVLYERNELLENKGNKGENEDD